MTDAVRIGWFLGRGLSRSAPRGVRLTSDGAELRLEQPGTASQLLGTVASLRSAHVRTGVEVRSWKSWPTDALAEVELFRGKVPKVGRLRVIDEVRGALEGNAPRGLVICDESGPVVAVDLLDFTAQHGAQGIWDGSGASQLIASLGLEIESPAPLDRAARLAEGRALVRPHRRLLAFSRLVWALCIASAAVGIFVVSKVDDWPGQIHVVECVLLVAGTVGLAGSRLAFLRSVRDGLDPADRSVFDIGTGVPGTQLQVGPADVVVVLPHDAEEQWYAGPAAGGVKRIEIGREQTWLTDSRGEIVVAFESADLVSTDSERDRLRGCCQEAGIEVAPPGWGAEIGSAHILPLRLPPATRPGLWMSSLESGELGLSVPIACGTAAAMGLIAPLGPGESWGAVGWCLVGVHVVCGITVAWGSWSLIRWRRSMTRASRR